MVSTADHTYARIDMYLNLTLRESEYVISECTDAATPFNVIPWPGWLASAVWNASPQSRRMAAAHWPPDTCHDAWMSLSWISAMVKKTLGFHAGFWSMECCDTR